MKKIKIEFSIKQSSITRNQIKTRRVAIWQPNCFKWFLNYLSGVNTEMSVYLQGSKLIIQDKEINFYKCIVPGDMVEIPLYDEPIVFEDDFGFEHLDNPHTDSMMREWGLK